MKYMSITEIDALVKEAEKLGQYPSHEVTAQLQLIQIRLLAEIVKCLPND